MPEDVPVIGLNVALSLRLTVPKSAFVRLTCKSLPSRAWPLISNGWKKRAVGHGALEAGFLELGRDVIGRFVDPFGARPAALALGRGEKRQIALHPRD